MCEVLKDQLHIPVILCSQCLVKVMSDRYLHFTHSGNEVKNSRERNIQLLWSLCTNNTGAEASRLCSEKMAPYCLTVWKSTCVLELKPFFQKRIGKRWMSVCILERNIMMHIVLGTHYYRSSRFAIISASISKWLEHPGWRIISNVLSWHTWSDFSLYPIIIWYTLDSHLLYTFAILVAWCASQV